MEKWYVAAKKADFDKWAKEFHISPVTARILRNRDLTEDLHVLCPYILSIYFCIHPKYTLHGC